MPSLYDLELAEVIVDAGESAKTLARRGLQRALAILKRGEAAALLVVKLDRSTAVECAAVQRVCSAQRVHEMVGDADT
jgi:hypothetical protein